MVCPRSSSWTGPPGSDGGVVVAGGVRLTPGFEPITAVVVSLTWPPLLGECSIASGRRSRPPFSPHPDVMPSRPRTVSRPSTPAEYSSSTVSTHSAGPSLRSHLFNIIPKHALFKVKVHVRQISNVPLLGGDFAVKWRFRNVQSPGGNHSGLLSKMKANSSTTTMTLKGKTKDYFPGGEGSSVTQSGYPWTGDGSTDRATPDSSSSPDYPSPVGTKSSSSFSVISPGGTSSLTPTVPGMHSDSRGVTTWTELSDHTATWDHHITLIVRMDVDRETDNLHASELKLTVLQVLCLFTVAWCGSSDKSVENRPR